uniref:Sulfatase domain-containing protein n=1 Tax=Rhabditophanes sp. KR3021 TaxID=114890 RepID=A0AC35UEE1_9BILA
MIPCMPYFVILASALFVCSVYCDADANINTDSDEIENSISELKGASSIADLENINLFNNTIIVPQNETKQDKEFMSKNIVNETITIAPNSNLNLGSEKLEAEFIHLYETSKPAEYHRPQFEPRDPKYAKFFNRNEKGPVDTCSPTFSSPYLSYKNGFYTPNPQNNAFGSTIKCFYACQKDINYHGRWISTYRQITKPTKPKCDVFRTKCQNIFGHVVWGDVNYNAYKQKDNKVKKMSHLNPKYHHAHNGTKYSVHMIYIDSVGSYTFDRTMPKTSALLGSTFKAFNFYNHHKIGENTLPNQEAILMNLRFEPVVDLQNGRPTIPRSNKKNFCKTKKDEVPFIPEYFKQNGYKTIHSQDYWYTSIAQEPYSCYQFPSFDHDIHTFARLSPDDPFLGEVWRKKCLESYKVQLAYLQQIMSRYSNKDLFSFNFFTNLQHDSINGLYHSDTNMAKFFKDNKHHFDNSFVFISSDHGVRYGKYREATEIAGFENINPFLRVIVPKQLQANKQFMDLMNENSKKATSQFDVFASLIDILTEGQKSQFTDFETVDFSNVMNYTVNGQSIFRKIPERDEYDMRIPFNYRFYKHIGTNLNNSLYPEIRKNVINTVIKKINGLLAQNGLLKNCARIKVDPNAKLSTIKYMKINNELYFNFKVKVTPGTGIYIGTITSKFEIMEDKIRRITSYAVEAETCEKATPFREYCMCKSLLSG